MFRVQHYQYHSWGKHTILHDVLHVPSLCCPLISICCIRRLKGCSFLSNNSGCFLTFPTFFLQVDDSSDCITQGHLATPTSTTIFYSRLVGVVSAISDNTRHRLLYRPVLTRPSKATNLSPSVPHFTISPDKTSKETVNNNPLPLPIIPEEQDLPISPSPEDCNPNSDGPSQPSFLFSPKQITDILMKVTHQLETHGRILETDKLNSRYSTSTTPSNHSTLLSSDKMSNTAPMSTRFTVQQLSCWLPVM